jgi:hypothetical protein
MANKSFTNVSFQGILDQVNAQSLVLAEVSAAH